MRTANIKLYFPNITEEQYKVLVGFLEDVKINYKRIKKFDNTFITYEELQAVNKQIEEQRCNDET